MSEINIKSPTRVDLAGGTLDCWPLNAIVGKCYTINLSISVNTYVDLIPRNNNKKIELDIFDLNYKKEFNNLNELLNCADPELILIQAHLKYWQPTDGFYLKTRSESPVGGGLGGSSSLSVSVIKAFSQWLEEDLTFERFIRLASNVEAYFLNTPTGTQDYIGAYSHGLNLITYDYDGIHYERLDFDDNYFKERLLVVYTGKSHHSGINNWQVIKDVVEKDAKTLEALHDIARVSSEFRSVCINKEWEKIPQLLNKENEARIRLSAGFSNPEIDELKKISFAHGAKGFKICGAGGGGCIMIWSEPDHRQGIINACQEKNYQVIKADPVTQKV